jgi:hypothetical protein
MMPNVNIPNPIFNRLQGKAVPLVDDLESVLTKLLDFWDQNHTSAPAISADTPEDLTTKTYPADAPPDLTYTSVKSITLNGKPFKDRYWNPMFFQVVALAATKLGKDKVHSLMEGNYSTEELKDYRHIPEANLYVQGRESNLCWRMIHKLAKAANISVAVEFFWQDKPTAAFPGHSGRFVMEAK